VTYQPGMFPDPREVERDAQTRQRLRVAAARAYKMRRIAQRQAERLRDATHTPDNPTDLEEPE